MHQFSINVSICIISDKNYLSRLHYFEFTSLPFLITQISLVFKIHALFHHLIKTETLPSSLVLMIRPSESGLSAQPPEVQAIILIMYSVWGIKPVMLPKKDGNESSISRPSEQFVNTL